MPRNMIRAVHMLSSAHSTTTALRTGQTTPGRVAHSVFFNKKHFPKVLGSSMFMSGVAGWKTFGAIKDSGRLEN